ncbi:MAG: MerR family transcriptional regulator [Erysipelotrichaceae bacterium]|nr:MerR family transcriptional regulator [Erysipelotrichaceae bacterium]
MLIDEFAKQHALSVDTLRHYMSLGLLVVEKQGEQYIFDDQNGEDLVQLLGLKSVGFSLEEVKLIFMFQRLGHMTDYQRDVYYQRLFSDKHKAIEREVNEKQAALDRLVEAEAALKEMARPANQLVGVPLSALELLSCPACQSTFRLDNEAQVVDEKIQNARMSCDCGNVMVIDEGILYATPSDISIATEDSEKTMLNEAAPAPQTSVLEAYLTTNHETYLGRVYEGLNWLSSRVDFSEFHVAMEIGSGFGFYLRTFYDQLPEDMLYIAVDRDPERHRFLKQILEAGTGSKKILQICCSFESIPLKPESVDCVLDFSGTSNYSFEHADFLLDRINQFVTPEASLYASYIIFEKFGLQTRIPPNNREHFKEERIRENLAELGFNFVEACNTQATDQGGFYEDFFQPDESVRTFLCVAKRLGMQFV